MANTIITKNSSTASAVPTSGDLVQGELAVNVTDKRLFTEDSGGTVVELGVNPTSVTTGNLTASGNLGLGVVPSAWGTGGNLQLSTLTFAGNDYSIGSNYYQNSGNKYIGTGPAALYSFYNGQHAWYNAPSGTAGNAISFTQAMTLDASGNLGLGGTPSAWSGYKAMEFPYGGSVAGYDGSAVPILAVSSNAYFVSGVGDKYVITGPASRYLQNQGVHAWYTAPSGTAGAAISFTQAMTLDASGNLGVGTTTLNTGSYGKALTVAAIASAYGGVEVSGTTGGALEFQTSQSTRQVQLLGNSDGFIINVNDGSSLTQRLRITASGNVGIGTSSPSASAILDAQSTTKGVRMPNMTTTQKNAIASPAAGLMVFDTTLAKLCVYSGAAWQTITSI